MADSSSAKNESFPEEKKRNRSTSFLRPDQLRRKRELDREGQRQLRARTKARIQDLEAQVVQLTQQLINTSATGAEVQPRHCVNDAQSCSVSSRYNVSGNTSPSRPRNHNFWNSMSNTNTFIRNSDTGIDPIQWADLFSSTTFTDSNLQTSSLWHHPSGGTYLDQQSIPVWEALPKHLEPTCRLDKILLDLIRSSRTGMKNGGNTFEFSNARFPSVNLLLNPEGPPDVQPVTSRIVKDVIYVQTVPTLPEQIAIMFVMCLMIRWQISPTEQNYDALPEFLRPVPAQLVTSHPAWLDTFPWPKARERICRHSEYHDKHNYFKAVCNQTISINWPYEASDTLLVLSDSEFMVNPIFEKHIRNLSNWTVGPQFLDLFPEFQEEVNIGIARDAT